MRIGQGKRVVWVAFVSLACTTEASELSATEGGADELPSVAAEPALGISIVEVEVNQGTRVAIGSGGEWLELGARTSELIAGREAMLRVHVRVEPGWLAHDVEARLSLEFADGTSTQLGDRRFVERDSTPDDGVFEFALTPKQALVGARYRVELWDEVGGAADEVSEGDWANPASGAQPLGFVDTPLQIKTLLVPITYEGVTALPDEATTAELLDNLYEQNPVTEVLYDVREPISYEGQLLELAALLPVLAGLREADAADPNVYYHALVSVGSQSLGGKLGISGQANDTQGDAGNRVSATVLWTPDPSIAAETYTHETGHAQGLSHVECPNRMAAAPDPDYPHADGLIGNWGWAVRRELLFGPDDTYDYMSYCAPSWVSDWTWNKTRARIETLTAWDFGNGGGNGGGDTPSELLLVGASYADGSQQWWTMHGTIDPARIDRRERVEFVSIDGERLEAEADVTGLSDGQTTWTRVALPRPLAELSELRHVRADEVRVIARVEPGPLVRAHRPRWQSWRP